MDLTQAEEEGRACLTEAEADGKGASGKGRRNQVRGSRFGRIGIRGGLPGERSKQTRVCRRLKLLRLAQEPEPLAEGGN